MGAGASAGEDELGPREVVFATAVKALPAQDSLALCLSAERVACQLEDGDVPTASPLLNDDEERGAPLFLAQPLPSVSPETECEIRTFELVGGAENSVGFQDEASVALAESSFTVAVW